MPHLSDTAQSLLTILNNINELIVKSSDRKSAEDVMKALVVFAKGKQFPIPQDKVDNFHAILIDARPVTLTLLIKDIADDILLSDSKNKKEVPRKTV